MPEIINSPKALPVLPVFSQATVASGNLVFVSGNIGCDENFAIVQGGVGEQTKVILGNIQKVLEAANSSLECIVKANVYMRNMAQDFEDMNKAYAQFFDSKKKPARTCIGVAFLPFGADVEIECIAEVPPKAGQ